jgi:hypothetical protein
MSQEQATNRWLMWMLISAMFLRNGFRDEISDGWMTASSVVFLVAVCGIFVHQVLADGRNRV